MSQPAGCRCYGKRKTPKVSRNFFGIVCSYEIGKSVTVTFFRREQLGKFTKGPRKEVTVANFGIC
jgi:hypothetical protein